MSYTPVLFQAIAKEVAKGFSEQYLASFSGGALLLMFTTPALEDAIDKATAQTKELGGVSVIAAEFMAGKGFVDQDCVFADECGGVMDVGGILVEVSIRKIREDAYRVLFARVNSARLYKDISGRLKALEKTVESLAAAG